MLRRNNSAGNMHWLSFHIPCNTAGYMSVQKPVALLEGGGRCKRWGGRAVMAPALNSQGRYPTVLSTFCLRIQESIMYASMEFFFFLRHSLHYEFKLTVSWICSPGWPGTGNDSLASTTQVQKLQMCTTMPGPPKHKMYLLTAVKTNYL